MWEGGSLWVFDVPEAGGGRNRRAMHRHHAYQLTFTLGGHFFLHFDGESTGGPVGVVPPDVPHAFEAYGQIAHLFIEPESRAGRSLEKILGDGSELSDKLVKDWGVPGMIKQAFDAVDDPNAALRDVGIRICEQISGQVRAAEPDRRVRVMLAWASDNLDSTIGMAEAASHAGLSASRASHLFVEETGIPFRQFVLWLRLTRAVQAYATGRSLTTAAHEAGFADSAHLSRTFRRMFGLPAAALQLS